MRAKTTTERISGQLGYTGDIVYEPLMSERDFGAATGRLWEEVAADVDAGRVAGLETVKQLAVRMEQLLEWLKKLPAERILAVGHGTAEAMLQTIYAGRPFESFLQTKELDNAEVREYRI